MTISRFHVAAMDCTAEEQLVRTRHGARRILRLSTNVAPRTAEQ